jgi:predicted nucleic acid-binding protein
VWVDHLRHGNPHLQHLLDSGHVVCHPFVIGELACGYLQKRERILTLLSALPQTRKAEDSEVLDFIARNRLMGAGLGLIDIHILAAARLSKAGVWTSDKALAAAAKRLRLIHELAS